MKIAIDTSIFRDYDIRGTYPDQINKEVYYLIGRAIAVFLQVDEIAVGYDMRLSSPILFEGLTGGIMDQSTDVVDLGLISTEMHYFASGKFNFPANIIISASHNPGNYNGLKIVTRGVKPLHGEYGLPEIKKLTLSQNFPLFSHKGKASKKNIMEDWIKHALSFVDVKKLKPLKVVVDAGNGMGGVSWENITGKLPVNIIPMYFTPDGSFPHHLPDPLKNENLEDIRKEIKKQKADLGFAIDGDADRLFVVDNEAQVLSGTVTTALLSEAMLSKYGPNTVLYNVVCGKIVPETIKKMGGTPIRVRVGHSFIKEYMRKYHALFAGEHSGHFYFRDNYNAESSLIAGLIILEYLSEQNQSLSSLIKKYQKYQAIPEVNFKIYDRQKIIKLLENQFRDAQSMDYIDGLSVFYPTWWFNLRSSKTEPLLRLNIEADTKDGLKNHFEKISRLIISAGGVQI